MNELIAESFNVDKFINILHKYKIFCFVLAVFLSVSGMCFEKIKTDSLFAYVSMEETSSYLLPCYAKISEDKVCTTEMLSSQNFVELQQLSQYASQKREMKISLDLLCFDILSLAEGKFASGSETIQSFRPNPSRLVTTYIHQSDGKKRF